MHKIIFFITTLLSFSNLNALENSIKSKGKYTYSKTEVFTVNSKILERKYDLYIKVPFDYFKKGNESKTYPILYLNDAPYTFKVATGITHQVEMDKAIIVGISRAHGEHYQYSRVRDLTPENDLSWKNHATGGARNFLKFIENEVFYFVENKYRVNPDRRILSGHSLGGSFGAWVMLTKPKLFSSYILTSPSLWFKNDLIFDIEERYASKNKILDVNVYIATGALETTEEGMMNNMVDGHRNFLQLLSAREYGNIQLQGEIVSGTDHYSTFPVGLTKGLRWIYKDLWKPI